MKKGLLATTALVGVGALTGGAAFAAEAPSYKLSGNMNFQLYWIDQDHSLVATKIDTLLNINGTGDLIVQYRHWNALPTADQDHAWYFGVDEAELQLKVSGAADNGLKYGFKIELNASSSDETAADETVISLSGGWGTLQFGDEDGAEDIMNYGGENLMGAAGGFDGDHDDVLYRKIRADGDVLTYNPVNGTAAWNAQAVGTNFNAAAPSAPKIAGDSGDATKITYYSPRFSGFQVGASITPNPSQEGDFFKSDGTFENHYGLGANYDNTFGNLHIQASAVYSAATRTGTPVLEDISAWSVGGIVGWGAFSVGANYTDNGDSSSPIDPDLSVDSSYWDAAAKFETGPMAFAVGYFSSLVDVGAAGESTYTALSLTADYTVAPGLNVYAEYSMIEDELLDAMATGTNFDPATDSLSNDASVIILGINASF